MATDTTYYRVVKGKPAEEMPSAVGATHIKVGNGAPEEIAAPISDSLFNDKRFSTDSLVSPPSVSATPVDQLLTGKMPSILRKQAITAAAKSPELAKTKASLKADLEEFKKAQKESWIPLNFETWAQEKHAKETGRPVPGILAKGLAVAKDIAAGRPEELGGGSVPQKIANLLTGGVLPLIASGQSAVGEAFDYGTPEEQNLGRYATVTAPKASDPTFKEGMKALWENKEELPSALLGGFLDPQQNLANVAGLATGAGVGAAAARTAALGSKASALARLAAMGKGIPASMAADAAVQGGLGAYGSGEFSGTDFASNAAPGLILGAPGALLGHIAGRVAPKVDVIHHAGLKAKEAHLQAIKAGHEIGSPEYNAVLEANPLTATDVLQNLGTQPESPKYIQEILHAAQQPEVQALIPNVKGDALKDPVTVRAALQGASEREAAASAPAPTLTPKQEAMKQAIPDPSVSDAWFNSGTKREQDQKLVKAHRAYQELRRTGAIEADPRFEGKTEATVLGERIKEAQAQDAKLKEMQAADEGENLAKQAAIEENDLRMQALNDELEFTKNKDAISGKLRFAHSLEKNMEQPGALREAFAELSPKEQRLFLQNVDEMGDVGEKVRDGLGPVFAPMHELATNTSIDDASFAGMVKRGLKADAKRTEKMLNVQGSQRDAAFQTQAHLDPIYDATGIEKPALGRNAPTPEPGWVADPNTPKVVDAPADGAAVAKEQHIAGLSRAYASMDELKRVELLAAELKVRPEIAQEIGIAPEVLADAESKNPVASKEAKAKITEAINREVAASGPELPAPFR